MALDDSANAAPRQRRMEDALSLRVAYFVLAVFGFSFWFFVAVPFASHRETYWWLATIRTEPFGHALSFMSSTYRPLHQVVTWVAFLALDPETFPTRYSRQALLQFAIWALFVLAWWLAYAQARERRLVAGVACLAGAIYFSGYVHLFHIYGLAYVPVMLMLGVLLRGQDGVRDARQEWIRGTVATILVFWHPFATALFVGALFGNLIETFGRRSRKERARSAVILSIGSLALLVQLFALPRYWPGASTLLIETASRSLSSRLHALVVSYQTNEVHWIASTTSLILAFLVILGTRPLKPPFRNIALATCAALAALLALVGFPFILLWLTSALLKLAVLRRWSLFFLLLTAIVLPLGGGIGTPVHGLFAIIVAVFATAVGWEDGERMLERLTPRAIAVLVTLGAAAVVAMRAGVHVPLLTTLARPLLAERERTYQLEQMLAWLHRSEHCRGDILFSAKAGNPVDSVESAITRRHRPPAPIEDVALYWRSSLQCPPATATGPRPEIFIGFAEAPPNGMTPIHEIPGRYAGAATAAIASPRVP